MLRIVWFLLFISVAPPGFSQTKWTNVDSLYQPLPSSVHVFYTNAPVDSVPFRAYYVIADLKDKGLDFTTDTTYKRRFTPTQFYQENNMPLVVVNGTFFSFETNGNLNVVIKDGKLTSLNSKTIKSLQDTTKKIPLYSSAIGITKKRKADIAWIKTDSTRPYAEAIQYPYNPKGNFFIKRSGDKGLTNSRVPSNTNNDLFKKWKVQTAIGGGPVLVQKGKIKITNEEERMFAGKGLFDKHPRTAMGYTADGKLIILVVEGRNTTAGGATLTQEAQLLKDLGCVEALNLDGGGSSCLLINGKETIAPSDKKQRAVPAVFIIQQN